MNTKGFSLDSHLSQSQQKATGTCDSSRVPDLFKWHKRTVRAAGKGKRALGLYSVELQVR